MYTDKQKQDAKPMIDEYKALGLSDIDSIRLGVQMWESMNKIVDNSIRVIENNARILCEEIERG